MREGVNLHQQMCVFLPMLQIFIFTSFWLGFFWGEGGVRVARSLVFFVMFCRSLFVLLYFFFLVIVLFGLLRFTDSDITSLVSYKLSYLQAGGHVQLNKEYHEEKNP